MAKGPWDRDPTGLSRRQVEQLDEKYLRDDGSFDGAQFPNCDLFHVNTVTWLAAGLEPGQIPNTSRMLKRLLEDPVFPAKPIRNDDGRIIALPTNTNTVIAWRKHDRTLRVANQVAGTKLFPSSRL